MRNTQIDNAIARALSRDRLNKYLTATGSNLDLALALYERNTRLAEAFYTPLQAMEVAFRNHLDLQMAAAYGADWMTNGQAPLHQDAVDAIHRAIRDLGQSNKPVTPGAIVAELHFFFWVSLLGPRYDATLWRKALYKAFSAQGRPLKRKLVHGRFNALRRFRNRVAHHEPIFTNDLERLHSEVLEAIGWMCPDTAAWTAHHSRFLAVFSGP